MPDEIIQGADWSDWQGIVNCVKSRFAGIRFTGIKVSQGVNHRQTKAAINNNAARAAGILTFPYHFVTTDAPLIQYNWFINCIGDMKFDLPPALDYEFYNQMSGEPYLPMREADFTFPYGADELGISLWASELGIVIPSAYTLYFIANKLKNWRNNPVPAVYSNPSTANSYLINSTSYNWSQFLLWIANWNITTPVIPKAWTGQPYYIWQDKVIRGAQEYGVDGDMDHDIFGAKIKFPGTPPTPTNEIEYTGFIVEQNRLVKGILK